MVIIRSVMFDTICIVEYGNCARLSQFEDEYLRYTFKGTIECQCGEAREQTFGSSSSSFRKLVCFSKFKEIFCNTNIIFLASNLIPIYQCKKDICNKTRINSTKACSTKVCQKHSCSSTKYQNILSTRQGKFIFDTTKQ
jgi:hypothetical protein